MTTILDPPGQNPPNPFSRHVETVVKNPSSAPETAILIAADIAAAEVPSNARWEFWDAFWDAVVSAPASPEGQTDSQSVNPHRSLGTAQDGSSHSHLSLFALLDAFHKLPVTDQILPGSQGWNGKPETVFGNFGAQWRATHDILEAHRSSNGTRGTQAGVSSVPDLVAPKFLRFCEFSATLLASRHYAHEYLVVMNIFFACKKTLESEAPSSDEERYMEGGPHYISTEELQRLDVRVAAIWIRDAGRVLAKTNVNELRPDYSAALDEATYYYPHTDGLTKKRWMLWLERLTLLKSLSPNQDFQALVQEAREVLAEIVASQPALNKPEVVQEEGSGTKDSTAQN